MNKLSQKRNPSVLLLLVLLAMPLYGYLLLDYFPRYLSWSLLTSQEIKEKAEDYSKNLPVCLYVVECTSGLPKLKLLEDFQSLDLTDLKKLILKRKLFSYCAGETENIVLDFPEHVKESHAINDARWSFYNDRFITNHGHFQGSYVSRYPWQQCTESNALWGKKD